MNCPDCTDRLNAHVDGELPAAVAEAVAAHIRDCDECARELDALRRLAAATAALPRESVPADFLADVRAKISTAPPPAPWREWWRECFTPEWNWQKASALAAASVMMAATGLMLMSRPQPQMSETKTERTPARETSPPASPAQEFARASSPIPSVATAPRLAEPSAKDVREQMLEAAAGMFPGREGAGVQWSQAQQQAVQIFHCVSPNAAEARGALLQAVRRNGGEVLAVQAAQKSSEPEVFWAQLPSAQIAMLKEDMVKFGELTVLSMDEELARQMGARAEKDDVSDQLRLEQRARMLDAAPSTERAKASRKRTEQEDFRFRGVEQKGTAQDAPFADSQTLVEIRLQQAVGVRPK